MKNFSNLLLKKIFLFIIFIISALSCQKKADEAPSTISEIKPAFAVRGALSCVFCHANIQSNVVSDFGLQTIPLDHDAYPSGSWYGSATPGGSQPWNVYMDHDLGLRKVKFKAGITFYAPTQAPPESILNQMKARSESASITNFIDYLRVQFAASTDAGTKAVSVEGLSSLFIGAPTADRIKSAFFSGGNPEVNLTFVKSTDSAPSFSGLTVSSGGITNTSDVVCEGDLFVNLPLKLENVTIKTDTGCRIYSTSSVFIYGSIVYSAITTSTQLENLQITSSRSINLGLGTSSVAGDAEYSIGSSSLTRRYSTAAGTSGYNSLQLLRGGLTPAAFSNLVRADAAVFGTLTDAYSRPEGRTVNFERLLLNAPSVHSRYAGSFKGSIIAEVALMSLSNFPFEYDPVFDTVGIFTILGGDAEMIRMTK